MIGPRALAAPVLRLTGAVAVLLGARVAVKPAAPEPVVTVALDELRRLLDLASYGHELDPAWLRTATTERLDGVARCVGLERLYRDERWATVEAGGWPAPEEP